MLLSKNIKKTLKENAVVFSLYRKIDTSIARLLYNISPVVLAKYRYILQRGELPNLKNPKTFDEKLLWLMLYWNDPVKSQCADKYAMRLYVEERGLGGLLPGIVGIYNDSREVDFDNLPEKFVIKCTHGSGSNIICKDKTKLNVEKARIRLDVWMKTDISKVNGEIHYAQIKPRIICESFLDDSVNDVPIDYKFFCFSGKVHCTMVCTDRGKSKSLNVDFYDVGWRIKLPYSKSSQLANRNIPKPEAYEEMIAAAENLSKPFKFVRMDFYSINGKAVLGEMTFTPNGCIDLDYTDGAQIKLGELIEL